MIDKQRMLDSFLELIRIDSESGNELAVCERLVEKLKAIPGTEVRTEAAGDFYKTNGYNIVAWVKGSLPGAPILLSAHTDTVVPGNGIHPVIEDGIVRTDGTTVLAADDKAGAAQILEAVTAIKESGTPHRDIEIIFSVGEEQGLYGAKSIDVSKLRARQGYILDTGGQPGRIVTCQPGQISFTATVTGRSAHAGNRPEEGISAIQAAARAVANMELLRVDELTTANIGVFESVYPTNIVPESCFVKGEVRSRSASRLEEHEKHIYQCFKDACEAAGASLKYEKTVKYLAYDMDLSAPVVAEYVAACERLGVEPLIEGAGGGSDANIYNQQGMQCIVVGTGMYRNHTSAEILNIEEFGKCAELIFDVLTH